MRIIYLLIGLFFPSVYGNVHPHQNGLLPQLINVDGSLTSHNAHQSLEPNHYSGNYYSQNQQPYQGGFLSQAGNDLKHTAQGVSDQFHNAGEALGNAPQNLMNGINNMGHQISQTFDNFLNSGLSKLNDLKGQFTEKFRPLLDNAIQIFQTPRSEKEKWNEVSNSLLPLPNSAFKLVQRVESTNLNEAEKQQLYQRIADAVSPQQQNSHQSHHKK